MQNVEIFVTWHTTSAIKHCQSIACITGFRRCIGWYKWSSARGDIQTGSTCTLRDVEIPLVQSELKFTLVVTCENSCCLYHPIDYFTRQQNPTTFM
jgi:hypothetical protein